MHVPRARASEQFSALSQSVRLVIVDQPQQRFRFRYESELGGTHGQLAGSGGTERRSYPTVKLEGWSQPAIVRCELYSTMESSSTGGLPVPHVHTLQGKNCNSQGRAEISVDAQNSHTASFQGLGIIHTAKKHMLDKIIARKLEEKRLFMQRVNTSKIWCPDETDISEAREVANRESVLINMNRVCLRFQAFVIDPKTVMPEAICNPVYSDPIYNGKSAQTGELKIVQLSHPSSPCTGNREIWLLVERVRKNDIRVRLFEENEKQQVVWCEYGRVVRCHHQYAIIFQTPSYWNLQLTKSVRVFIQLERPSDGCVSEPKPFQYTESEHKSTKRFCQVLEYPSPMADLAETAYSDASSIPARFSAATGVVPVSLPSDASSGGSTCSKTECSANGTAAGPHVPSSGVYGHQISSVNGSIYKLQCTGYPGVIHEALRHHQYLQDQFHTGYRSAPDATCMSNNTSAASNHLHTTGIPPTFQRNSSQLSHLQTSDVSSAFQRTSIDSHRQHPAAAFNRFHPHHQQHQLGVTPSQPEGMSAGYQDWMDNNCPKMMRMSQKFSLHQLNSHPLPVQPANITDSKMMEFGPEEFQRPSSGTYSCGGGLDREAEQHNILTPVNPLIDNLKTSCSQNGVYSSSGAVLNDKELSEMLSQLPMDSLNEGLCYSTVPYADPLQPRGVPVRGMNNKAGSSAMTSRNDIRRLSELEQPTSALDLTNHRRNESIREKNVLEGGVAIGKNNKNYKSPASQNDETSVICKNHCLQCSDISCKIKNAVMDVSPTPDVPLPLDVSLPPDVALHFALTQGDTKSVREIIRSLSVSDSARDSESESSDNMGSIVNASIRGGELSDVLNTYNQWYQTPLHLAVTQHDLTSLQLLLKAGGDPANVDHRGNTVLHTAALCGALLCVELLLSLSSAESLIHQVNDQGLTALHMAVVIGHWHLVDLLCRHGAEVNAQELMSGRTLLHLAVETGNTSILRKLLNLKSIDVDKMTYAGKTALQIAQHLRYQPMVTALVNAGAATLVQLLEPVVGVSAGGGASGCVEKEIASDSCPEDGHTESDDD